MNPSQVIKLRARGQRWAMRGARECPGIAFYYEVDGIMYHQVNGMIHFEEEETHDDNARSIIGHGVVSR